MDENMKIVNVRVTMDIYCKLLCLANEDELTPSDELTRLINKEHIIRLYGKDVLDHGKE